MQRIFSCLFLLCYTLVYSQDQRPNIFQKKTIKTAAVVHLDSLSIQTFGFKLVTTNKHVIDTTTYKVDYSKATLFLDTTIIKEDSLQVSYFRYPDFLTTKYSNLDPEYIVPENKAAQKRYKLTQPNFKTTSSFLDGLSTSGSISRGITVGNNQNSVFNSELDLQISGKISNGVTLKASLQDSNIPIQQGGYSQTLDEFDQIFIELTGKNWGVRAGDIQFSEQKSTFNSFTKKLQGLSISTVLNTVKTKTEIHASGALVRGEFARSNFNGQEGNQGPYKLIGQNGELFVLIVSGSERVYANGLLLTRGESNDYIIDYNAGEIRFNATYPITADMRIVVEYQTSQRNYARIFGVTGAKIKSDKWELETLIYSENDLKDQTLQQNLSNAQKEVLSNAGDDSSKMLAESAIPENFSENSILYKNIGSSSNPIYEFSSDPNDELFQVRFSLVGDGNGNYQLVNETTVDRIFEYIAPISGIPQGNFEPIIQLDAPNKLQVATIKGSFSPNKKTVLGFEFAGSNNDLNLFSNIDDSNNTGGAAQLKIQQQLFHRDSLSWKSTFFGSIDVIEQNYRSVERLYNVEFNRDWNLNSSTTPNGQLLTSTGIRFNHLKKGSASYTLEHLKFKDQYTGNRHSTKINLHYKNWLLSHNSSILNTKNIEFKSAFLRNNTTLSYAIKKWESGVEWATEKNEETNSLNKELTASSQGFKSYEIYTRLGDTTTIFTKIGARYRENDSLQNNQLQKIATSNTYYLNSKLINTATSQLNLFVNYRILKDKREIEKDNNLNSRLIYRQQLWKNRLQWNTLFETQSGTVPQQEFTYVEVDAGKGLYTWNDYNNNGTQELQEFELSPFPDQATYVRIFLPRRRFEKIFQNKLSQQLNANFSNWSKSTSYWQQLSSHFHNQTSYVIDRKIIREGGNFNLNIFEKKDTDLGLNLTFRNSLFFNRGKQYFSSSYTYLNTANNNLLVTGKQSNSNKSNRFNFNHKIKESWLFDLVYNNSLTGSTDENFENRNYTIAGNEITPKISYLLSRQSSISLAYTLANKKNRLSEKETLNQQQFTTSFRFGNQEKTTITGSFDWFENKFKGNAFSPVSFELLNGLEPGTNFTWNLLAQKKLTKFLELNVDYSGRKGETSKTIHTGNIQLRAFF